MGDVIMDWKRHAIEEINNHTECAVVDVIADGKTFKLGICRYISGDDNARGDADEFNVIATNTLYGLFGYRREDCIIKSIEKLSHPDFEKRTGIKREKYGRKAVNDDYAVKILQSGTIGESPDNKMKVLGDFKQAEDEADI